MILLFNFSVYHSGMLRVQGGPHKECETVRNIMAGVSPAAFFLDMGSGILAASSALASYYLCNYLATPIEERWVSIEWTLHVFSNFRKEINSHLLENAACSIQLFRLAAVVWMVQKVARYDGNVVKMLQTTLDVQQDTHVASVVHWLKDVKGGSFLNT